MRPPAALFAALLPLASLLAPGSSAAQAVASPAARPQAVLHEIEVISTAGPEAPWASLSIELELHPDARDRPAAVRVRDGAAVSASGRLRLKGPGYPGGADAAGPQHLASSFVIDWEEPEVRALAPQLLDERGRPVNTPEGLRAFVDGYITDKGLTRAYDAASVVAKHRRGDCSEHAVLLCALLRMHGHASRVAHGVVLVRQQGRVQAFGHAWVELRRKQGWQVLDAALMAPLDALYIPLGVMENEGPGHSLQMWRQATPVDVVRVVVAPSGATPEP